MAPHTPLAFEVRRREPEMITPAKPTPSEFKSLSDIDDQDGLRFQSPFIHIYRNSPTAQGTDPAKVIREALARALVFYYPFAGRLREGPNRKLMVECNGEGILFTEADADVTLEQLGGALHPPFSYFEDLLFDVPGTSEVLNCPLLLIQVTRLKCGGFIFALRLNHTMSDAFGLVQFMTAVAEMARGLLVPSTMPVWERHILNANDPPLVTCRHHEFDELADSGTNGTTIPVGDMVEDSFFFGPTEISTLRTLLPSHLRTCSTFELVTACLWKCRTLALQIPNPAQEMRIMSIVNARNLFNSKIPIGYYGNAFAYPAAVATAGELSQDPISYALELVKKAKAEMSEEYLQSVAALMVTKGRPCFTMVGSFILSDQRHAGFADVDFGWGKALYGGSAKPGAGAFPGVCYFVKSTNEKGQTGIVALFSLPKPAMTRFAKELDKMLNHNPAGGDATNSIMSSS